MEDFVYSKTELFCGNEQRAYADEASVCKFPLGGIGTGNISIGSRGQLCDWEIFNSPGKGNYLPYTFFAVHTAADCGKPIARVLESQLKKPHERSHGYFSGEAAGLPRLAHAALEGLYPFAKVKFKDQTLPLDIEMEAFTPFIPLNADDSGIPGAVIRFKARNISTEAKEVSIAGSLANGVGFDGFEPFGDMRTKSWCKNEYKESGGVKGLFYTAPDLDESDLSYGSMALATSDENISVKPTWKHSGWWDGIHGFWDDFSSDGRLEVDASDCRKSNGLRVGSLAIHKYIEPGEEKSFTFFLCWHFPNRPNSWHPPKNPELKKPAIARNYYASLFTDSWDAALKLYERLDELEGLSRSFCNAIFSSTLPGYAIEAAASNIAVIRSTTCFRLHDGTFLAWEGCFDKSGSCEGNCSHVWNYAQTLAFLFPELEHSMRKTEFLLETGEDGMMAFRTYQVFGGPKWDMLPAADGQLGTIIRLYRDWKFSGDSDLLILLWPKAKKALEFAFSFWDLDKDFVLDSKQHNTYDIEFYGPNSLTNSIFFAALKAGAEMARFLGDDESADMYLDAFSKGSAKLDELLWNGEYYIQALDDPNERKYQYGEGCLSDQLLGQELAHVSSLGYILPEGHVKKAIRSVFSHNFRTSFAAHENVQRTYALNDEKGLLLCSWPRGGRPSLPFVYCDEVWTGIEYQVAAHLIFEGFLEEGLTVAKAARERFDGFSRNPWNEIECGNHYARSLSSWSLIIALSGYEFDLPGKRISFSPKINSDDFSCFFSTGKAWGVYRRSLCRQTGVSKESIETLYGSMGETTLAPSASKL
ncbi:MAG: hypothetical protein LBU32_06075 [Clostridiales bacterium]|jgi:uncharacterized protein (DUF608 family)|nr:hypothetical protein [Clostridiales bacterium]